MSKLTRHNKSLYKLNKLIDFIDKELSKDKIFTLNKINKIFEILAYLFYNKAIEEGFLGKNKENISSIKDGLFIIQKCLDDENENLNFKYLELIKKNMQFKRKTIGPEKRFKSFLIKKKDSISKINIQNKTQNSNSFLNNIKKKNNPIFILKKVVNNKILSKKLSNNSNNSTSINSIKKII